MEVLIWTAIILGIALLVWALAPYHQRLIDNRDVIVPDNWD